MLILGETVEFIPDSEKGKPQPATFIIKRADIEFLSELIRFQGKYDMQSPDMSKIISDPELFKLIENRIADVRNVKGFDIYGVRGLPVTIAMELFTYLMQTAMVEENTKKN